MSVNLRVKWTIVSEGSPRLLLHCSRCGGTRSFISSEKVRVNANGKRVDAWLIYKCASCDATWNRPILERRHVRSIDPEFLASLRANDPDLARRIASDNESLKGRAERLEGLGDALVLKHVLSKAIAPAARLEILCAVPHPLALRLDRLLSTELQLPRSRIQSMEESGELCVFPSASRVLRRPVRDGMRLTMRIPADDADRIARAATGRFE